MRVVEDEPAIPASEMCAALHHLAAFEFGLAQALHHLTVCVDRSAEPDLFWAADAPNETHAWALAGVASAADRLGDAEQHAVQMATMLTDACEDLVPEAHALKKRLLARGVTLPATETTAEAPSTAIPGSGRARGHPSRRARPGVDDLRAGRRHAGDLGEHDQDDLGEAQGRPAPASGRRVLRLPAD